MAGRPRPNSAQSPGSRAGRGSRRSKTTRCAGRDRREGRPPPPGGQTLCGMPSRSEKQTHSRFQAEARRIRRTSSHRPARTREHRQAAGAAAACGQGFGLAAVQADPARVLPGACRFAPRTPAAGGRCRDENEAALMGSAATAAADCRNQSGSPLAAAQWPDQQPWRARSNRDQLIRPVAAGAAPPGQLPQTLQLAGGWAPQWPCAPAPGAWAERDSSRRHRCRYIKPCRRCQDSRSPRHDARRLLPPA